MDLFEIIVNYIEEDFCGACGLGKIRSIAYTLCCTIGLEATFMNRSCLDRNRRTLQSLSCAYWGSHHRLRGVLTDCGTCRIAAQHHERPAPSRRLYIKIDDGNWRNKIDFCHSLKTEAASLLFLLSIVWTSDEFFCCASLFICNRNNLLCVSLLKKMIRSLTAIWIKAYLNQLYG